MINIKKNTNYGYFNVSQHVFLRYRIADDFVYVVMKRHLCVESRLSALSAAILTSNGLIDRFSLWLPGCFWNNLHQVRFWNNLHQVRFWNNLHPVRFWNNLHQVRFWNNLHQVRFWNNLHQIRSKSKDWKVK